ncbi:MAG: hypothetical protein QM775_33460 [Pirellulales bacterium]
MSKLFSLSLALALIAMVGDAEARGRRCCNQAPACCQAAPACGAAVAAAPAAPTNDVAGNAAPGNQSTRSMSVEPAAAAPTYYAAPRATYRSPSPKYLLPKWDNRRLSTGTN